MLSFIESFTQSFDRSLCVHAQCALADMAAWRSLRIGLTSIPLVPEDQSRSGASGFKAPQRLVLDQPKWPLVLSSALAFAKDS